MKINKTKTEQIVLSQFFFHLALFKFLKNSIQEN
jgi:hypothetical protein